MKKYFKLLRIHHYLKNFLIFVPLIFSGQLFEGALSIKGILGLISFSLVTSFIYIINDLRDVEEDKKHPIKCKRPIASGEISPKKAYSIGAVCITFSLWIEVVFLGPIYISLGLLGLYIVINIFYSMGLKKVPIVDVSIIVLGFIIRVFYGGIVTQVSVSEWLYLTVIFMSFYLALGKRRNELDLEGNKSRSVLAEYNRSFLDKTMYMCLGLTIASYSLWCIESTMVITVPVVLLVCMKYSLNIEKGSHGDPVDVILGDYGLMFLILIYLSITIAIIYIGI